MGRADRPPRHGIQCQFGNGTAMEGIPRALRLSTRDWSSSAPVRNPGTTTAAFMFGRFAVEEVVVLRAEVYWMEEW